MKSCLRKNFALLILGIFYFLNMQTASACIDGKFFRHCQDQNEIYQQALTQAQNEQKTLVVVIGYEACVWCQSLGTMFNGFAESPIPIVHEFVFTEVATHYYNMVNEDFDKISTGLAVRDQLLSQLQEPQKISGYPTIFVINPRTKNTAMIQTGELEENDKVQEIYGHDQGKVIEALRQARETVAAEALVAHNSCKEITGD